MPDMKELLFNNIDSDFVKISETKDMQIYEQNFKKDDHVKIYNTTYPIKGIVEDMFTFNNKVSVVGYICVKRTVVGILFYKNLVSPSMNHVSFKFAETTDNLINSDHQDCLEYYILPLSIKKDSLCIDPAYIELQDIFIYSFSNIVDELKKEYIVKYNKRIEVLREYVQALLYKRDNDSSLENMQTKIEMKIDMFRSFIPELLDAKRAIENSVIIEKRI